MTTQIDALTDQRAIAVLALVVDHERRLPDPDRLQELEAQISQAAGEPVDSTDTSVVVPVTDGVSDGALARETLTYLVAEQPQLLPVVERATVMTQAGMGAPSRFDPATVGVGALMVLALQTDLQLERTTGGKWRFKLHKKAMSDSTLGRLLGKLIATYTGGTHP